jgi:aspartate racemase
MKKLGIIGGMGSEATVNMFKSVIDNTAVRCDQDHLEIVIHNNSHVPDRTEAILNNGESPVNEILRSVKLLERCEVDLIIIPCMTSHYYYSQIQSKTRIKILNAIHETVAFIKTSNQNLNKIGILATTGTIESKIFQEELEVNSISSIVSTNEDQSNLVMGAIYGIKAQCDNNMSKKMLLDAAETLIKNGAKGIIAGCTEIPLVLKKSELTVPLINPIEIMAFKAIAYCGGTLRQY